MRSLTTGHYSPHRLFKRWGLFLLLSAMSVNATATSEVANLTVDLPNTALMQSNLPAIPEQDTMAWPLLPYESVADLAALFYPQQPAMQAVFIARTLVLNDAAFGAKEVSPHVVVVMIPTLKSLANGAPQNALQVKKKSVAKSTNTTERPWDRPLIMSYGLKDAAAFFVSPALVAAYTNLVARNASLKIELDALNVKLAGLQTVMSTLLAEGDRLFAANPLVTLQANSDKPSLSPLAETVHEASPNRQLTPHPASTPKPSVSERNQINPDWQVVMKWVLVSMVMISTLIMLVVAIRRKRAASFHEASRPSELNALGAHAFSVQDDLAKQSVDGLVQLDFSLTNSADMGGLRSPSFTYQDESEQILEQAQMYRSLDRIDVAIGLLRAQIKTMPKASLRHWLYLLDMYRDTNKQEEFEASARDLHSHYNVAIPTWQIALPQASTAQTLEAYPHVMETLTKVWVAEPASAKAYLAELLTDTRQNERTGFSMAVFEELVLLEDVLAMREKMASDQHQP